MEKTIINVDIYRSDAWLREQRLAKGHQYPERVKVEVCPADLSREAREIILGGNGYTHVSTIGFDAKFRIYPNYSNWDAESIIIDDHEITPAKIDAAIRAAARRILDKKELARQAEIERLWNIAKAEREQREREKERQAARELIDDEIKGYEKTIALLQSELAELREQVKSSEDE